MKLKNAGILAALLMSLCPIALGQQIYNSIQFGGDLVGSTNKVQTVKGTNGATLPTSALVVGTNSSGQIATPSIANQTVLCNGSGSSSAPVACALGGNLAATSSGLTTSQAVNAQTGTSYALLTTDAGKLLTFSNASAIAVSLSQATTTGFTAGYSFDVENLGAGTVTITPSTSTINGASTLTIAQNTGCTVTSDGANYQVSACTAVAASSGGTVNSGSSGHLTYYASSTNAVSSAPNSTISAGALTLGASGTAGSLTMGNATSGTVTLQPVTGALGSVTASLPAATDTVVELTQTQTLTNKTISGASNTLSNIALSSLATQAADTIVMNATGSTAAPTAVALSASMVAYLQANTTFTIAPTGCTPSAHTGGAFGGTITLASGPCTSIVVTMNGATGFTAAHGYKCSVGDRTTQTAGTWIPEWNETTSSTTTATIPIPAAAGATDVITFGCAPN